MLPRYQSFHCGIFIEPQIGCVCILCKSCTVLHGNTLMTLQKGLCIACLVFIAFKLCVSCFDLFCLAEQLEICGKSFHFTWKQWWQSCPHEWRMIWHVMQLIWTGIRRTTLSFMGSLPDQFTAVLLAAGSVPLFCVCFSIIVETECVSTSSFSWCHALQLFLWRTVFSSSPTLNQLFLLPPSSLSSTYSSSYPSSPPFSPHDQPFHLLSLPPPFFFLWQIPLMCYVCLLARCAHTHTHTYAVLVRCCRSIMWPSSNQPESRLLDQPNICLCGLSQSEWLLMLVPVSTCCCCFVCFLFCLRERKSAFPARGGSWINSAPSALIAEAQLIIAAQGYAVTGLVAQLTHSLSAALDYIVKLQWRASREDCFLFLCGGGEGVRKSANFRKRERNRITDVEKEKRILCQARWPDGRDVEGLTQHVHWSKAPSK